MTTVEANEATHTWHTVYYGTGSVRYCTKCGCPDTSPQASCWPCPKGTTEGEAR